MTLSGRLRFSPSMATMLIIFIVIEAYARGDSLQSATAGPDTPARASTVSAVSFGKDGFLLTSEETSTHVQVHGFIQADGRFFASDQRDQSPDKLFFRRIRPIFEGTLFNALDFHFMPDFGQNNPQIQDAYLELKLLPFMRPRVGKFKSPVGLENLRSDSESSFSERSLASDVVPLREVGAQISGAFRRNSMSYAVGYFNGAADGSNGNFVWRPSNEVVARMFLRPFVNWRANSQRGFGVGAGVSAADDHGSLPSFKTVGQNIFFHYSTHATANGGHNRLSPQAYYYAGPVGVMAEYNISSQEVRNGGQARRLRHDAWQVTASLMLTGEKNSYAGVRPHYAFEPQRGFRHLGGWELAARYSRLGIDKSAFPLFADPKTAAQEATECGIALNWYLNRFARIMNAYEHTSFSMASPGLAGLHSENVVMSRLQLAF